jgi:hypothetical protein
MPQTTNGKLISAAGTGTVVSAGATGWGLSSKSGKGTLITEPPA